MLRKNAERDSLPFFRLQCVGMLAPVLFWSSQAMIVFQGLAGAYDVFVDTRRATLVTDSVSFAPGW